MSIITKVFTLAIAEAGLRGEDLTKDFFREEYTLNYAIGKLTAFSTLDSDQYCW